MPSGAPIRKRRVERVGSKVKLGGAETVVGPDLGQCQKAHVVFSGGFWVIGLRS